MSGEAIIYGVPMPDADGKAGMAAIIACEGFDLAAFKSHMDDRLPAHARPRFVRLLQHVETTGTFEYKTMDLIKEGFDPSKTDDPLYILCDEVFQPLTPDILAKIEGGEIRL